MSILQLHAITERMIAQGKGHGTVGVDPSTFRSPDDDSVVLPASGAHPAHLEPAGDHGIGGWFLVIQG